jgi:hypothetical protein
MKQNSEKLEMLFCFENGSDLLFYSIFQGSPIGRSSTPIDCAGSPHSPGGVGGPPQSYPDAMAMAGPNYQHFMELTNDVQKLSVVCF